MSIDTTVQDGICTIVINRPERMNAMDAEHYRGLSEAWCRVRDEAGDPRRHRHRRRRQVLHHRRRLKSFVTTPPGYDEMWLTQRDQLLNRGLEVWKPVIAAVNGYCLGGGMTLLLGTDIRVAAEHATFSLAEVKRGVIAGNGGTQRILRQLPHAIAMEMLLTGDSIDAATAARWGLVNKRRAASQADGQRPSRYARRIAANAPLAVQAAKELALRSRDLDLASGLRIEQVMNRMLMATEDAKEGPAAFAEKRPPRFQGK